MVGSTTSKDTAFPLWIGLSEVSRPTSVFPAFPFERRGIVMALQIYLLMYSVWKRMSRSLTALAFPLDLNSFGETFSLPLSEKYSPQEKSSSSLFLPGTVVPLV